MLCILGLRADGIFSASHAIHLGDRGGRGWGEAEEMREAEWEKQRGGEGAGGGRRNERS